MYLILLSLASWMIMFKLIDGSTGVDRHIRGGGDEGDGPEPQKVDPTEQANANVQAQLEALPKAAELQYQILTNPNYGLQATSQAYEDTRKSVFPNEQAVREQLVQNVLQQLISPTGLSPEQQQAVDARRTQAQNDYTEALRTRANLGGGLFGGRSARTEQRAIGDLQNQFAEEDINRQERNRLNNQQIALAIMGALFPNVQLQQPQFINPVASADTQYATTANQNNLVAQLQSEKAAQNAALQSSLYSAFGESLPSFSITKSV